MSDPFNELRERLRINAGLVNFKRLCRCSLRVPTKAHRLNETLRAHCTSHTVGAVGTAWDWKNSNS